MPALPQRSEVPARDGEQALIGDRRVVQVLHVLCKVCGCLQSELKQGERRGGQEECNV